MANSRARSFDAFQPGVDNWTEWKERLDFYLEAEGITDNDKKRSVLLTVCGKETYSLVKSLVAPNNVKDKSFEQIVSLLDRHLQPKPSVTVARFKFNMCLTRALLGLWIFHRLLGGGGGAGVSFYENDW